MSPSEKGAEVGMRQDNWDARKATLGALCGSLAVVALGVGIVACSNEDPVAPSNVIVTQNVTVGGTNPTPGTSPSPGSGGTLPAGSRAAIFMFGQDCASGVTPPPNGTRQIKLGCTAHFTCTPKGPDGTDLPASVHGPTANFLVIAGSDHVSVSRPSESFNLDLRAVSVGTFTLSCTVKDVTGTVDGAVIGATGSSADVEAMDGQPLPPGPPHAPSGGPMGK